MSTTATTLPAPAATGDDPRAAVPAVRARDLHVRYGTTVALEGVDLDLDAGLVHGVIGMNGSGKSSLFKALMGLVPVERGTIELHGGTPAAARRTGDVAYAPQSEAVDWEFPVSVADVVLTGRYGGMGLRRRAKAADHAAVDRALERVELTDLRERQIGRLSGGQRKRAFVARGLAQGARLLFLDEPFAGVDKRSEATITALLRDLAAEGCTVVVSTHDLIAVPALCDRVALVNRRIVATGTPGETLVPDRLADAFGGFVPAEALRGTANPSAARPGSSPPDVSPARPDGHAATPDAPRTAPTDEERGA